MDEYWTIDIVLKSKDNRGRAETLRRCAVKDLSIDDKYVRFTNANGSECIVRMKEIMYLTKQRVPDRRERSGAGKKGGKYE